jgi:hypothetical protein
MELPTFTPLTPTALNLTSQVSNISIPSVQAPTLDNLAGGIASNQVSSAGVLGNLGNVVGGAALGGLAGAAIGKLGGKNIAISAIGGAAVGGLAGAAINKLTSGMGGSTDSIKNGMENLSGAARAKVMSLAPELPEQAKGIQGVMEKGVDLGKFQEKSVGNLMSKVSDFSPGKSIIDMGKQSDALAGIKDKLNSLKPSGAIGGVLSGALGGAGVGAAVGALAGGGKNVLANAAKGAGIGALAGGVAGAVGGATSGLTSKLGSVLGGGSVGNTVASGVAGALGGEALGKLTGQSVNLKGVAGNLAGSVGGGIGAQLGSKLVGSPNSGLTGVGAAVGGTISGMIGGSAGKKALTGLAAGVGVSAITGLATNKLNNAFGIGKDQGSTQSGQSMEAPMPPSQPPDISKNTPEEITKLEDESPQSVPSATPPIPPPSPISDPPPEKELLSLKNNIPTYSVQNEKEFIENMATSKQESKVEFVSSTGNGIPFMAARGIFKVKFKSLFGSTDFEVISAKLANAIKNVTPEDRARVKSMISSYPKNFSLAYMRYSTSDDKTIPEKRTLGIDDYIAMDTEDFYKFLTTVAEGQFELSDSLEKTPPYKIFVNQKSPSEVTVTISHPVYGTATSVVPKAIPPPINELLNIKGIKECIAAYHFGQKIESDQESKLFDALDPYDGAMFRMYAFKSPTEGIQNAYCCAKDIIVSSSKVAAATGDKKGSWDHLPDTPREQRGPYSWLALLKISENEYFRIMYNAYTMEIHIIEFIKMVPKT